MFRQTSTRRALLIVAALWLAGCAGLPPRGAAPQSHAIADVAETRLARILASATPAEQRGLSGFRLLPEAAFAFNARIALARRAEKSLDVQYYLIAADDTGRQFLRELRDAAGRGVRVRVLVDDLYAAGEDELFVGLAAHPNVELRIFNPLPMRGGGFATRLLFSLPDFARINHRMHNKLLIADNTFSVSGGRNIADEYFMRSEAANFIDQDVLASGPVVREFSAVFDRYWNSARVYPIASVASAAARALAPDAARARFDALVRDTAPSVAERERDVLGRTPVAQQLDAGALDQLFATARVFADSPDKGDARDEATFASTVTGRTLALFASAQRSVEVYSPYFIPGERGLDMMRRGTAEGGRIELMTNSIGATDEPLVYQGYARYRLPMLKAGVTIHELSPTLSSRSGQLGEFGRSLGRLHAKVAVIDGRYVFVGSMNMDPRSAFANTEAGLVIDGGAALFGGTHPAPSLREMLRAGSYELRLSADGERVEWLEPRAGGEPIVHRDEPDANPWLRLKLWFLSTLIGEDLL